MQFGLDEKSWSFWNVEKTLPGVVGLYDLADAEGPPENAIIFSFEMSPKLISY